MEITVVPLVGTWIEIYMMPEMYEEDMVVPLVGTWIEMIGISSSFRAAGVVPLVGTWIEMCCHLLSVLTLISSFPSWERGLKSLHTNIGYQVLWSFPSWERGLKSTIGSTATGTCCRSPRGNVD